MSQERCQAKDPVTCWHHGNPIQKSYEEALEQTAETGVLPSVLFHQTKVNIPENRVKQMSTTLTEFMVNPDSHGYGFPPYPGEPCDFTAWIEPPLFNDDEEEKEWLKNKISTETNEYDKGRYESILKFVSEEDVDNKIIEMSYRTNELNRFLYAETGYETSPSDAAILNEYGKRIDANPLIKTDLEKAIVMGESLKEIGFFDKDQEFGSEAYLRSLTGSWKIYKAYQKYQKQTNSKDI